jgi:hypothetical protein
VLVWWPHYLVVRERRRVDDFYASLYSGSKDMLPTAALQQQAAEGAKRREEVTFSSVYETHMLFYWPWVLAALVVPPALFYGASRAIFRVVRWLVRGFKAEA